MRYVECQLGWEFEETEHLLIWKAQRFPFDTITEFTWRKSHVSGLVEQSLKLTIFMSAVSWCSVLVRMSFYHRNQLRKWSMRCILPLAIEIDIWVSVPFFGNPFEITSKTRALPSEWIEWSYHLMSIHWVLVPFRSHLPMSHSVLMRERTSSSCSEARYVFGWNRMFVDVFDSRCQSTQLFGILHKTV